MSKLDKELVEAISAGDNIERFTKLMDARYATNVADSLVELHPTTICIDPLPCCDEERPPKDVINASVAVVSLKEHDPKSPETAQALQSALKIDLVKSFDQYLTPEAKKIHDTKIQSTVIDIISCSICKTTDLYHRTHPNPSLPNHENAEYEVSTKLVQYMGKTVFTKEDGSLHESDIKAFAQVFNYLVEQKLVGYGTLLGCLSMPLANCFPDKKQRSMLLLYVASDYDPEELNAKVGNYLFVQEGELPNMDWSGLPVQRERVAGILAKGGPAIVDFNPPRWPEENAGWKAQGLCPKCGDSGRWINLALVCPDHGTFAG